jgi:hypothetical protein
MDASCGMSTAQVAELNASQVGLTLFNQLFDSASYSAHASGFKSQRHLLEKPFKTLGVSTTTSSRVCGNSISPIQ